MLAFEKRLLLVDRKSQGQENLALGRHATILALFDPIKSERGDARQPS
jgi:hypothetical protein